MVAPYAAINLIAAGTKGAAIFIPVTNSIENMMGTVRRVCRNVKRWRNTDMALRWTAAGMMEAAKGFRRLKAYKQLPVLRAALTAHQSKYVIQRVEHDTRAAYITHGDACFAYFNKIWGIPPRRPTMLTPRR